MLQIDHIYEFLYQELFKDFSFCYLTTGAPKLGNINIHDISIFTHKANADRKIMFYDQEPFIFEMYSPYMAIFAQSQCPGALVTSEYSAEVNLFVKNHNLKNLYYFFHGFAALDWYRGYYTLNFNKTVNKQYSKDFISFNRIINNDRSYRIYFVSLLNENKLLDKGLVSFNVTDNLFDTWEDEISNPSSKLSEQAKQHIKEHLVNIDKLIIDKANLHGSASADIPRTVPGWFFPGKEPPNVDAFWHIVTETVFYYDKLHLTEKIFKPIVSKQPFMLLAAPGNLEYLRSYGFKTFNSVIDETYDSIIDNDTRTEAVVNQLSWYCKLSDSEKKRIIHTVSPIVEHNFHHFYGEFRHIIARELLDNTKTLFGEIGYDDSHISYDSIYQVLTR